MKILGHVTDTFLHLLKNINLDIYYLNIRQKMEFQWKA
jgi:hypothetical protein